MSTKKRQFSAKILVPALVIALSGIAVGVSSTAHADTTTNYKQAFTASGSSMSGVFDVAGDESSISYWLGGVSSGSLECETSNGSWIDVADLSSSGMVSASSIMPAAINCNPAISTTAHLIQDMREGKIALVSGGMQTWLTSGAISTMPPSVMGMTTSTTTPSMGGGSTSTTTMPTMPTTTTMGSTTDMVLGTTTVSASDLRVDLNNILRGHVSTSLEVLRAINNLPAGASTSPELAATLVEQDQNAVDLSNAIGSIYGSAAGTQFLALFRAHIVDSNAYTMGIKDGSVTNQQAALADLDTQLQNIASFLSTANPNLSDAGLLAALRQHEMLVNQSSVDYTQGDYADAYSVEQQALTQISGGADYIAAGIVAQYPGSFTQ